MQPRFVGGVLPDQKQTMENIILFPKIEKNDPFKSKEFDLPVEVKIGLVRCLRANSDLFDVSYH